MIFILAENEPTLFIMLVRDDLPDLHKGLTKFVDPRHIGDKMFNRVIVSLHKNKAEIMKLLGAKMDGKEFVEAGAIQGESKCAGCSGTMPAHLLFEGKCICCWANQAKGGLGEKISIKPV